MLTLYPNNITRNFLVYLTFNSWDDLKDDSRIFEMVLKGDIIYNTDPTTFRIIIIIPLNLCSDIDNKKIKKTSNRFKRKFNFDVQFIKATS